MQPGRAHDLYFQCALHWILAGIDDKFPLSLWCRLLKPTKLTLNLLRQLKVAHKISVYAHVHGPHNYMKKQFAPLGCAIQAHIKPEDRHTWDTQSDLGFSLSTSMEHHRCFWVNVRRTRATRISDTVFFFWVKGLQLETGCLLEDYFKL